MAARRFPDGFPGPRVIFDARRRRPSFVIRAAAARTCTWRCPPRKAHRQYIPRLNGLRRLPAARSARSTMRSQVMAAWRAPRESPFSRSSRTSIQHDEAGDPEKRSTTRPDEFVCASLRIAAGIADWDRRRARPYPGCIRGYGLLRRGANSTAGYSCRRRRRPTPRWYPTHAGASH